MDVSNKVDLDHVAALLGVDRSTLPSNDAAALVPMPLRAGHRPIVAEPLTDAEFDVVKGVLPAMPVPKPGVDYKDREFIDAVLWFRAAQDRGFGWGKLPERYSPRATKQHRWHRWVVAGTWMAIADALRDDKRLSEARRETIRRIAVDASQRRERILDARKRLNESP